MDADVFLFAFSIFLLVLVYYGFIKTSFEVFTYRRPSSGVLLLVSLISVPISLLVSYFLGFLVLLAFLACQRLSVREVIVVALTTQFGFMMGMAVVMLFLTGIGFVFDIPAFKMTMSPEDIMRFLRNS